MRKKERFVLGKRTFRSQKSKHFVLRIIYALPPTHVWNPGMIYTYTLNMKSGYNCEVDVDHVPMYEEYLSTF